MTVPLDAPPILRGPRETLLMLTESYLHGGELGVDARHTVARLAGRVGVPGVALPDWGPLASALASMLRGEAERALQVVLQALQVGATPSALNRSLLGLGVRAALATERPVLARRWRAGLARRDEAGHDDGREAVHEAVWASLPEFTRELLAGDDAGGSGRAGPSTGGGGSAEGAHGGPVLHVVMDAYRGEVISVPVRVEVVDGVAREAPAFPDGPPSLTIRVVSQRPLPALSDSTAWHVRFVGRVRALDVRSSDGSLVAMHWQDGGFVAVLHPPEYVEAMDVPAEELARRVTHVVVVPEVGPGASG